PSGERGRIRAPRMSTVSRMVLSLKEPTVEVGGDSAQCVLTGGYGVGLGEESDKGTARFDAFAGGGDICEGRQFVERSWGTQLRHPRTIGGKSKIGAGEQDRLADK